MLFNVAEYGKNSVSPHWLSESWVGGGSMQFSGFTWENNFEGIILLALHTECHGGKESISLWMWGSALGQI